MTARMRTNAARRPGGGSMRGRREKRGLHDFVAGTLVVRA
jgi:hypothetical protein